MRLLAFLVVLAGVLGFSGPVRAEKDGFLWGIFPGPWHNTEFQPYMQGTKLDQPSLWRQDKWTPEAWITAEGSAERVMQGLYASNIVTDQFVNWDDVPVLEVGAPFMKLSTVDQNRVVEFVDYVYAVTANDPNGMILIEHVDYDEPLGVYTASGLQRN